MRLFVGFSNIVMTFSVQISQNIFVGRKATLFDKLHSRPEKAVRKLNSIQARRKSFHVYILSI